jgi:hypothetical protein
MKVHSYTYNGKVVDVYKATIDDIKNGLKYKNYIEFKDKGIITRLYVKSFSCNDQNYTITVKYFFKQFVKSISDGVEIETETFSSDEITKTITDKYLSFYTASVDGMMGEFIRHGQFNAIVDEKNYKNGEYFIGDYSYPTNPLKNYDWMQPLNYNLTLSETGVTVNVIDTSDNYNLEYSLNGGDSYEDLIETEIPLELGSYTILIRAKEELYPFLKSFSIVDSEDVSDF